MQKRSFFKSPFGIAAIICFVVAFASPFIFVDSQVQKKQEATKRITPTATVVPSQTEENKQSVQGQTSYNQSVTPTPSAILGQASPSTSNTPSATSAPQPTHSAGQGPSNEGSGQAAPAVQTFQVNLKINGTSVGNVDMQEGNNQCDVLSRAKDQGKISGLLMKYDNSLGTNGVYQINGLGKENVVWWVYKVNGASPSQGCSFIKANGGDTVEWEYKGN